MRTPVRTMVVWCQDWPVVAAGVAADEPAAVFTANRVVASSEAARAVGVTRGLRRREAQRRCPELLIAERDLAAEARAFEEVLVAIEAFTPRLELTQPGTCLFATRGPARYFGFAARIAARSRRPDRRIVPPGASAEFLAPLPITVLDAPELTSVLWRLGLRTLGDFAALDPVDVLGRFAREGAVAHARAAGLDERLPDAVDPPPDMAVTLELDPPVERIDQVAFAARQLAVELNDRLQRRGAACSRVTIEAESEHGETSIRGWRHEGALSVAALTDRVRWQLDGWLSAAPTVRPSGGLSRLALVPDDLIPATGRQVGFWGGETEADQRAGRAIARLETVVGVDNVRVAEFRGGREPADAVRLLPAGTVDLVERQVAVADDSPWPGRLPSPSPVELFHRLPLSVVDADGRPVEVSGRGELSGSPVRLSHDGSRWKAIEAWAGPWLLDERWWDADRARRRARFQLVDESGAAWLAFIEGGRWWLAGTY